MNFHNLDIPCKFNNPKFLRLINTTSKYMLLSLTASGVSYAMLCLVEGLCNIKSRSYDIANIAIDTSGIIFTFLFIGSGITHMLISEKYTKLLEKESMDIYEWKLNDLIENEELIGHLRHISFTVKLRQALIHRLKQATLEELLDLDRVHRKYLRNFLLYSTKDSVSLVEAVLLMLIEHPLPEYIPAVRNLAQGHDAANKNCYIRELAQKCLEGLQREANSQNYHRQLLRQPTETGKDTLLRPAGIAPASSEPASELLRSATSSASASSLPGVAPASEEIAAEQTLRVQSSRAE